MFSDDELTALMATQTWISLNAFRQHVPLKDRVVHAVIHKLQNATAYSSHLHKNYLLVLGLAEPNRLESFAVPDSEDPTVVAAFRIAKERVVQTLFAEVEPQVLREKYYSVKLETFEDYSPSGT